MVDTRLATATGDSLVLSQAYRFRFTIKRLLFAVLLIAIALGVWAGWIHKGVIVRPPDANDRLYDKYFGVDDGTPVLYNIAVVEGTFRKSTWLTASLSAVRSGTIQELHSLTVGRSPNRIGEFPWITMKITLALGERKKANGRIVQLGAAGLTRGEGAQVWEQPLAIAARFNDRASGRLMPGSAYVIYAESDASIRLGRAMTIQEFAQHNKGNYFIVTAELQ